MQDMESLFQKVRDTLKNREDAYGQTLDTHKKIAAMWGQYLDKELTPQDVAIMMVLFKIVRETKSHKDDNFIDATAYLSFAYCFTQLVDNYEIPTWLIDFQNNHCIIEDAYPYSFRCTYKHNSSICFEDKNVTVASLLVYIEACETRSYFDDVNKAKIFLEQFRKKINDNRRSEKVVKS